MKGETAFVAHPAGFDSVRSIVAQAPWSGACARFALTNSAHLPSALPTGETFASFAHGLPLRSWNFVCFLEYVRDIQSLAV